MADDVEVELKSIKVVGDMGVRHVSSDLYRKHQRPRSALTHFSQVDLRRKEIYVLIIQSWPVCN
jgi:hypothetical protein